jgi:hypothetical protein
MGGETERALVVKSDAWLVRRWGVRVQCLQLQLGRCGFLSTVGHVAWDTNSGTERKHFTSVEPEIKATVRSGSGKSHTGRGPRIKTLRIAHL